MYDSYQERMTEAYLAVVMNPDSFEDQYDLACLTIRYGYRQSMINEEIDKLAPLVETEEEELLFNFLKDHCYVELQS